MNQNQQNTSKIKQDFSNEINPKDIYYLIVYIDSFENLKNKKTGNKIFRKRKSKLS